LKSQLIRIIAVVVMSLFFSLPAFAFDWGISLGMHNMSVEGARPLEQAPDGSTSYTPGVQVAFHAKSDVETAFQQKGYFKFLIDWDQDDLDPDHIPVWFNGEYRANMNIVSFSERTALKMVLDADSKANSVSSVERTLKFFGGVKGEYESKTFSVGLKTTVGYYFLEIDDDVPKTRGYGRDNFRNTAFAYSVTADTQFALGDRFKLILLAQTWQAQGDWLENQYKIQLDYDSNSWIEGSTVSVSLLRSEYNLDPYQRDDTNLPILPWSEDTLFQAYIVMPFG